MPPKPEEKACQLCKQPFSLTKRRHFCSLCHRTVCANCSTGNVGLFSSIRNKEGDNVCVKCKREASKGGAAAGSPVAGSPAASKPPGSNTNHSQHALTPNADATATTTTNNASSAAASSQATMSGGVLIPSNRPVHSSSARSTHSEEAAGGGPAAAARLLANLVDQHPDDDPGDAYTGADDMEEDRPAATSANSSARAATTQAQHIAASSTGTDAATASTAAAATGQLDAQPKATPTAAAAEPAAIPATPAQRASQPQRSMLPSNVHLSMSLSRSIANASFMASSVQGGGGMGGGMAPAGGGEIAGSFRPTSMLMRRSTVAGPRPSQQSQAAAGGGGHSDVFNIVSESVRKRHTSAMKLQPAGGGGGGSGGSESVKNASFLFGSTPMGSLPPQFFAALRRDALGGIPVSSSAWQTFVAIAPKVPSALALDHITLIAEVEGTVAKDHLHACINLLIDRHSMLRTTLRDGGLVVFPPGDCDFKVLYFTDKTEKNVRQTFEGDLVSPFSSSSPMFKVRMLSSRTVNTKHTLALVFHRAVACTASISLFMEDLRVLYQNCHKIVLTQQEWDPKTQSGSGSGSNGGSFVEVQTSLVARLLPRIPAAYEDYCLAQKDFIAVTGQANRHFWLAKVQNASPLELPTSSPRPAGLVAFTTNTIPVPIDADALEAIAMWARRECGASPDVPILAAFALLLKRFTGQDSVTVAVHTDARAAVFADTFGPMENFLTLSIDTPDNGTCAALVAKVRQLLVECSPHKDFPFSKITTDADTAASQGRFPFAQAAFVADNSSRGDGDSAATSKSLLPFLLGVPGPSYEFAGLQLTPSVAVERSRGSMFELTLHMWEARGATCLALEYATALRDAGSMHRMAGCFAQLLRSMAQPATVASASLNTIPLLPDDQRDQQLHTFNNNPLPATAAELAKRRGVHGLFSLERPTAIALSMPEHAESLTYAELEAKSNQLARMLRASHHVTTNTVVAIAMHRSVTQILCVLAVLKAGGGYLPLDLSYPLDRLAFMLADSNVACVLSSSEVRSSALSPLFAACAAPVLSVADDFDAGCCSDALPAIDIPPESTTYVIYTSGSTGKPKGVVMNHKALTNLVLWQNSYLPPRFPDRLNVLQFSPISFDVSFQEMFTTWSQGGTLVMVSEQLRLDPLNLIRFMTTHDIHRLFLPFVALSHICETALETLEFPSTLTDIVTAGEQLVISRPVATLLEKLADKAIVLHNHYGPSETHVCSYYVLRGDPKKWMPLPPIGAPIANSQLFVLDNERQIVPLGVVGELFIAGDCLGTGYLNRPDVTDASFVPCPLASSASTRMYKTGDLVQMLPDGNLLYVRRKDTQVKIRGFRIELGEIESRLSQHVHVQKCCVVVREDTPHDKQITAYVVLTKESAEAHPVEGLKAHLRAGMPEYMVPSAFVFLDALPLTPSGKINRKGLPAPVSDAMALAASGSAMVAPATDVETLLAKIWSEVLRRPVAGISVVSSFFDIGGHSLSITKVVSRINAALGIELPVAVAFKTPTIREIAAAAAALRQASSSAAVASAAATAAASEAELPATLLTYNEQSMAFLALSQPEHAAVYNISLQGKLHGDFALSTISDAFDAILKAHPALRTTYQQDPETGMLMRRVRSVHEQELDLNIIQLQDDEENGTDEMPHEALVALLQAESRKPFNLAQDSMMRVRLYRTAKSTVLQLVFHHIATDLWSIDLILDDLIVQLGGSRSDPQSSLGGAVGGSSGSPAGGSSAGGAAKGASYADYAKYMHRQIERGALAKSAVAWQNLLAVGSRELPILDLPTDFPRPAQQSYQGRVKVVQFSKAQCQQLRHLCQSKGVTLYVSLLSLLFVVLRKYSRQEEIVIGTPMGCRNVQRFEHTVGYFINAIAVLQKFPDSGETFSELLSHCKEYLVNALEHQEYPFPLLADKIVQARSAAYPPVFQTLFTFQKPPLRDELAPFVMFQDGKTMHLGPHGSWESIAVPTGYAMLDLVFQFAEIDGNICGAIEYNCDLFAESTITGMWNVLQTVLEQVSVQPATAIADIQTIPAAQWQSLVGQLNDHPMHSRLLTLGPNVAVSLDSPDCHFVAVFARVVADVPDHIAVQFGEGTATSPVQTLTFRELDAQSNAVALQIEAVYGGPLPKDAIVGVSIRRSFAMVVAMVAAMKCGAAYVPMDPKYPADRLAYMGSDSNAVLVIACEADAHLFPNIARHLFVEAFAAPTAERPAAALATTTTPKHLAYVIYTSGSTGKPKGVLLEQKGLINMAYAIRIAYKMRCGHSKFLNFASSSFDASVLEIFTPLLIGCTLVLLSAEAVVGETLARAMTATGVTVAVLPPSVLSVMPEDLFPSKALEVLVTAGEAINDELLSKWRSKVCMVNGYGPTENTVCSTTCDYDDDRVLLIDSCDRLQKVRAEVDSYAFCASRTPPIGRACANSRCYVVDDKLHVVGVGIPGELLVTGPGVARGYHNLPERTATSFIPNTIEPSVHPTMYRTGDLVRWIPSATPQLEFLGRIDGQVKLRGYRIELGEIEAVILKSSPLIHDCAVDLRVLSTGKALVAYLVLKTPAATTGPDGAASPMNVATVRDHLRKHVPEYMVPSAFVSILAMPLSPSGKVDRKSLPNPQMGEGGGGGGRLEDPAASGGAAGTLLDKASPTTPTQTVLLMLVREVLGSNMVAISDDFFEAGGHSLAAMQLAARLKEALAVEVAISKIFECSKLTSLAEVIDVLLRSEGGEAGGAALAALQPRFRDDAASSDGMTFPLSYNQEALWFAYTMDKQGAAFNVALAAKITSADFNRAAMVQSLHGLVLLHPMLRTRFEGVGNSPVQHVLSTITPSVVDVVWSDADEATDAARSARIEADCHQPLNLEAGEVVRMFLYAEPTTASTRKAGGGGGGKVTHIALLFHHIAMDLGSMEGVIAQLGALYLHAATPGSAFASLPLAAGAAVTPAAKTIAQAALAKGSSGSSGAVTAVTYIDYVFYQREVLSCVQGEKLFGYWQRQLAGYPASTPLPTDFVRPPHPSYNGGAEVAVISDTLVNGVATLAKQLHTTPLSVYLAAVYAWLFRVTGQPDIVIGMPVSGRTKLELEHVVGDFVNLAPLRVHLDDVAFQATTFRQLVKQARSAVVGALMHAEYPFQLMVQHLQQFRDPSRSPVFQVLLVHEKPHHSMRDLSPFILGDEGGSMQFGETSSSPVQLTMASIATKERSCQYDLVFALSEGDNGRVDFRLQYASDLFLPTTVQRFASQFVSLLTEAVKDAARPFSSFSMLTAAERAATDGVNRRTANPFPALTQQLCLHQLFEAAAAKHPDALAVINSDRTDSATTTFAGWTYRTLNVRANAIARAIRAVFDATHPHIALPQRTVCLYLPRGMAYIAAIVGSAKSCAAYTPIDVKIPQDRAAYIAQDSGASLVVTCRAYAAQVAGSGMLAASCSSVLVLEDVLDSFDSSSSDETLASFDENLTCTSNATSVVYVIYTSGSTGKPKGVQCHHGGVVNVASWFAQEHKVEVGDVSAQALGAAFDPVNIELWPYLISGASVVVMPDDAKFGGPEATISFLDTFHVTHLTFPTSLSEIIFSVGVFPPTLAMRSWSCGGDKFKGINGRALPFSVVNAYGPTETCIMCSQYYVNYPTKARAEHTGEAFPPEAGRHSVDPPLGLPTANTALYVVDRFMNRVPRGTTGELLVGGAQVGLGYRNRDDVTAAVFIPDPFRTHADVAAAPARVYRTGDLVRLDDDYNIFFVGRKDFQVKIRGFRIELGEIEEQLQHAHPAIRQSAVVPHEAATTGEKVLLGFVHLAEGTLPASLTAAQVKQQCRDIRTDILKKLKSLLPDYMVPSQIILLEKLLPLTANGKVDRAILVTLVPNDLCGGKEEEAKQRDFVPPVSAVEKSMCAIWEELLQTKPIGLSDNWYDRGGSSLTSTMLLSRMRQVFQMEVSIQHFFVDPTVKGLIKIVHEKGHIDVAHKLTEVLVADSESLDPAIAVDHLPKFDPLAEPGSFFVTGVTGFLGAFILMDLLQRTRANVFCLVRGKTESEASQRIFANLTSYKLMSADTDLTDLLARIIPVVGDLSHPNFGLSSARFAELAASVDVIIHNGALVNFSYPYVSLKAANVTGTVTTLRLATMHHVKPVHYVSTLSTVPSPDVPGTRIVTERHLAAPGDDLHGGYTQGKWVAEKLVQKAGLERGLPVTILRPGRITGDSKTGATNLDDFLNLLIKGCIQMGAVPALNMPCDMTPVDYCAAAINTVAIHHVRSPRASFIYHVTNPSMLEWEKVIQAVIVAGRYKGLVFKPYPLWRSEHLLKLNNESHCALIPLVPMFSPEFEAEVAPLDTRVDNLVSLLRPLGLECPAVTEKLVQTYIHYFIESKFLPLPSA